MKRIILGLLFIYSLAFCITATAQNRNLTGTLTASSTDCSVAGSCVVFKKSANDGAIALQVTGTFVATLQFEGSADYAATSTPTWLALTGNPYTSGTGVTSTTGTGGWQFATSGLTGIRVRASAYTSGTAAIAVQSGSETISGGGGNITQWNGTTVNASNGTSGNGDPRVNVASDNSAIANWGQGATGAAVPSGAIYHGGNGSGNLTGQLQCDNQAVYDTNTNGKTQMVGLVSGKTIYVCGLMLSQSTSTAVTVSFGSGTGTNCGTTYTVKTPAWPIQAVSSSGPAGFVWWPSPIPYFKTNASEELCISTSAGVSVQAIVQYTQF